MNIFITLIKSYLWKFFVNGKISWHSHIFCFSDFDDQLKGGYLITIQMQVYVWYFMWQNFPTAMLPAAALLPHCHHHHAAAAALPLPRCHRSAATIAATTLLLPLLLPPLPLPR
jgi:hypothetical protein